MKIGIAGIGRMGAAIGERVIGLGHELAVWNRTAEKTRALAAAGAKVTATSSDQSRTIQPAAEAAITAP